MCLTDHILLYTDVFGIRKATTKYLHDFRNMLRYINKSINIEYIEQIKGVEYIEQIENIEDTEEKKYKVHLDQSETI